MVTHTKSRLSAPTIPEDQILSPGVENDEVPSKKPAGEAIEAVSDKPAIGSCLSSVQKRTGPDAKSEEQQKQEQEERAVITLIQGVAIAQTKGGCWSIKQAGILNSAVKQLTGNAEPTALPPFDPSETPAEGISPQQRCVIYLIQAVGFGQAKGAYNLEQAAILDNAIDVLTAEKPSA